MPTCFLWAYPSAPNSTTSTGQGDIPISSTGCTCFLIDGSVKGQYVTVLYTEVSKDSKTFYLFEEECIWKSCCHVSQQQKTAMADQKPPFVFNNYLLLHLFKLIATSPLINSCPMQKQKTPSDNTHCFYVLFCLPSFVCASSLSMV